MARGIFPPRPFTVPRVSGFLPVPPHMQCSAYWRICGVQEYAEPAIEAPGNPQQERGCAPHILSVFRHDSNAGGSPHRVDRGQKHCTSACICSSICSSRQLIRGRNMWSNSSWNAFYFKPLRLCALHIHRLYISSKRYIPAIDLSEDRPPDQRRPTTCARILRRYAYR